ncbi:uncharacterized protein LOC144123536 isoform X2 [Amblyomma americanum]
MEPVEQDWRNPAAEPVGSMPRILDEFASKTAACKRAVNDSGAGTMLVRTLVFLFVVCLCVIFLSLVVTGSTWSSTSGGASKEKQSRVTESSIHVDAPRQPAQPVVQPGRKRAAARDRASPTGVQLAHNKEAKAAPPVEANLWNADKDDGEDEKEKNSPCGEPRQTYCNTSELSFFYRHEHDFCDSSFREQVFVCNHSPNRFSSLKGCINACIKNAKPFARCLQEPIFTKCNRNDVKSSYWYREGKACVEWKYPDGYCATKHRGVARSLRECRDSCMGPGTHEGSCTLPAEYTCPVDELRFPYFAHALPNGTVECLVADAEKLRPHKCMTGENKHATQDICREACARNKGPASTNLTPSPSKP